MNQIILSKFATNKMDYAMKKMKYSDLLKEASKPVYKDCAAMVWERLYIIYKDFVEPKDISMIGSRFFWAIEMESKNGIDNSILDIRTNIKENIETYLNKVDEKFKFIKKDFERILPWITKSEDVFKETSLVFKDALKLIDKDLLFLVNGGYFDQTSLHFFMNYGFAKCNKEVIKVNHVWCLKSPNTKYQKDIEITDAAFVWPSSEGFCRFVTKDGIWHYIDVVNGNVYDMPENICFIGDIHSKIACFLDRDSGAYGYINKEGTIVIPPRYNVFADFVNIKGESVAFTRLTFDEEWNLTHDKRRKDECCDDYNMNINVFQKGYITIKPNGEFTDDLKKKYQEQRERYEISYNNWLNSQDSVQNWGTLSDGDDDEEDIMRALENGYGDIFGF